jgi:hypothetical protein
MPTLSKELRRTLENVVADARRIAEAGAEQALKQLAVHHSESWPAMTSEEKTLREKLRAHGKQLGDKREASRAQEIPRLRQACAYEHWHRMLFARFLAENNLLIHPDYGEPISLEEVRELAREQNADWLSIAASFAQKMLLEVFRPDDPVLDLILPPETRQKLEEKLAILPIQVFTAEDSLGWVYQFWQRDAKDAVNNSEVKIGADELASVTQLFTEDYMVLFLLHNTLGAWWAAKRLSEGKDYRLPNLEWSYLRLNEEGAPAAGSFADWPKKVSQLRILDPCMGSGHFLASALPMLARMRMEEEGSSLIESIRGVLSDNLFGLELDARCSQIAAFNLAFTAWRLLRQPASLPEMNLACSGLGINASKESWTALAGDDGFLRDTLAELYATFQKAPILGSLIDPTRVGRPLLIAKFEQVWPLLEAALSSELHTDESRELAIAAKGVLWAARTLSGQYTLIATNVPYLGRGKQHEDLKAFCEEFHSDSKIDLATSFVDRCLRFSITGGSVALVTPQSWLFLHRYKDFRQRILKQFEVDVVIRLGARAFEAIGGEVVSVALLILSNRSPVYGHTFVGFDLAAENTAGEKAQKLLVQSISQLEQAQQLTNPDSRIVLETLHASALLGQFASSIEGLTTGDMDRFVRKFWEVPLIDHKWEPFIQNVDETRDYGGRSDIILWEGDNGRLRACPSAHNFPATVMNGHQILGKSGIRVTQMGEFASTLYLGEVFGKNAATVVPHNLEHLPAIWCFCCSEEFRESVKRIDQSLKKTNATFLKIPFDLEYWQQVAAESYANGLPKPHSNDETQWLFHGHPDRADHPLQVAVARLLGYAWPRQAGLSCPDCAALEPDGLDKHAATDGIVCLSSLAGEPPAADRVRAILADAYGISWSAAKLANLLGRCESLELWLRDYFFDEHCEMFRGRPFIWHIWDGRKDGFHALVNYHKLVGPNGEGRKTLEKLIYTSLGDWISRQRNEVESRIDGADARLSAACHLQSELEKIIEGEGYPKENFGYDIFVRWKPLHEQVIGWEPDLDDGIRLNMRPWLTAKPYQSSKKDACVLRVVPTRLPLGKSKGKEGFRDANDFPWFANVQDRNNDIHLSLEEKRAARERRKK